MNRRLVSVAFVALLVAGCSPLEEPERVPEEPESPATGERTVPEALAPFPDVLSENVADTGRTLTSLEAQAEFLIDGGAKPDSFRFNTVIVDGGIGSFKIATPRDYAAPWRFGTPTEELFAGAGERDPDWVEFWMDKLDDDDNPRAVALDLAEENDVVVLQITLTPSPGLLGADLAEGFKELYELDWEVSESRPVKVNGNDGAYVEYTVPASTVGTDRVQMQVLIPDLANQALWGVTCDVPRSLAAKVKPLCAEMAATFEPLPLIEG